MTHDSRVTKDSLRPASNDDDGGFVAPSQAKFGGDGLVHLITYQREAHYLRNHVLMVDC